MWELVISGKKILQYLMSHKWWIIVRKKWSHHFVKTTDQWMTTVPVHGNKDLPTGTVRKIMRDLELTIEDIRKAK